MTLILPDVKAQATTSTECGNTRAAHKPSLICILTNKALNASVIEHVVLYNQTKHPKYVLTEEKNNKLLRFVTSFQKA